MCGVIYAKSFDGKYVNAIVRKAYEHQRTRGLDGFGFVAISKKGIMLKRTTQEEDILHLLKETPSTEIMFHHRAPTSTDNNIKTNHPIASIQNIYKHNYYLIHNGVITNDYSLRKLHKELNIKYSTYSKKSDNFNDSECLLHELALYLEGVKDETDLDIYGSVAFVLIQTDKRNNPIALYFGRNTSPLHYEYSPLGLFISSQGDGEEVKPDVMYKFDYKTKLLEEQKIMIGNSFRRSYHNGWDDSDMWDRLPSVERTSPIPLLTEGTVEQDTENSGFAIDKSRDENKWIQKYRDQAVTAVVNIIASNIFLTTNTILTLDSRDIGTVMDFCMNKIRFEKKTYEITKVNGRDVQASEAAQRLWVAEGNMDLLTTEYKNREEMYKTAKDLPHA